MMSSFICRLASVGFLLFTVAAFSIKSDEIRFLHHFEDMKPEIAMGDPNPVQNTAKIVDDGWNFHGVSPGSGLEVVNGTRLDFNAEGNIDWNLGSLEFWVMPYVDMDDATNHKLMEYGCSEQSQQAITPESADDAFIPGNYPHQLPEAVLHQLQHGL